MITSYIAVGLASLSFILLLWQWFVAIRFPLHHRSTDLSFQPAVTLLKPLKGCDEFTEKCLQSWLEQEYRGQAQVLFGVVSADDPVCEIVRRILSRVPDRDAMLIVCGPVAGANAKVSKLAELERRAKHEIILVSDADVSVPADFLANVVTPLRQNKTGLVNCFYRLANPTTTAMQWEAVAINADFWSQVLQARSLKPLDFALGAVMVTRRTQLQEIGGFAALIDCLADDYQLGNRIAGKGHRIELSPVVVECWSTSMGWGAIWKHQLRWARTIRVCQPVPYFFSILSNTTLWSLFWTIVAPGIVSGVVLALFLLARIVTARQLQTHLKAAPTPWWMPLIKDLVQTAIWAAAFLGNRVEWRGQRMRLRRDGTLIRS